MSRFPRSWNKITSNLFCVAGLLSSCLLGCFANKVDQSVDLRPVAARSIALLENYAESDKLGSQLNESADGFRRITKSMPTEPLGFQNLSIVLLSRIKLTDAVDSATEFTALCQEFEASISQLRKLSPSEPDADVIASRYHEHKNERESAIKLLRNAVRTTHARPDTYFQLIELLRAESNPEFDSEIRSALSSALKLAPNNLVLSVAFLDSLAKDGDAALVPEAERCRELFRPLTARTNSPLATLLDKSIDAWKKSDWKSSQTQLAFLKNLLIREIAYQNDRNQLLPHVLDYVRLEFASRQPKPSKRPKPNHEQQFADKGPLAQVTQAATGLAAEDFDLDSHLDLVCAEKQKIDVWSIRQGGQPAIQLASVTTDINVHGFVMADLDHDYQFRKDELPASALPTTIAPDSTSSITAKYVDTDVDLIAYGEKGVRLYRNDLALEGGSRTLVLVPQSGDFSEIRGVRAVAVIDLDHDSDLDLVFASKQGLSFWSNRGDWTFANITQFSSLPPSSVQIESILAMDLDRNVLNDFLLGSDGDSPIFLDNNLHGRYKARDLNWGGKLEKTCRALECIDVNSDACWDVVACGVQGTKLATMKSIGNHVWTPDSVTSLSDKPMHGIAVNDFDLDGHADSLVWGKSGMELFRGGSDGRLEIDVRALSSNQSIQQVAILDIDRDGDDDLVVLRSDGAVHWHENVNGNKNNYLEVVIRADEDGKQTPRERCNMHGVGSLIELKSDRNYQPRIVRGPKTKFGLGQQPGADVMRVLWTNGIPNNVLNVRHRTTVFDQQNLGGSCPYLYAWNGERFEFCTDCLWAAPIGLQFAQGVAAPTREWEYLKIDGSLMRPRDGRYVLQVTEELWEAAYFDTIELMAIDHPKEIDVYSNEKVGPADLAQFRVFTVENRRSAKTVLDQRGTDWTQVVSKRDQRYSKAWTRGFNQGLVEDHWLEIDLNATGQQSDDVVLFLTGWVFPTCTSLNLAMTENPTRPQLKPPAIHVPNERGEWIEVIPYAGFPGGKTKTIAIDLTGKFLSADHRVRVVTNMELCWDEVFWTQNETVQKPDSYQITKLKLVNVDLHYRGFSALVPQPNNAPKQFVYDRATQESIWPPMTGAFTRYGNVLELVDQADDLQVVMGAGDELTLEFSEPTAPIPDGWVRDFIIYNVGWDKDADLNTIHGQDVGPLPFRTMTRYPYGPDETFPTTPIHRDFLERFQTRIQEHGLFWNQIRDAL
ncbi:MAG: VCBS repeat-containing protein [Pirellula sp.]